MCGILQARCKEEHLLLLGMYAGHGKPANLQQALALLAAKLKLLQDGVWIECAIGEPFLLRVFVAATCHDYIGFRDMAEQSVSGMSRSSVQRRGIGSFHGYNSKNLTVM